MSTNYTSLLGFALPTTGELSGTWGDTVNNSITELVEDAIAATATASVTSGNWTLSTTGSGSANEARCAILIPTGTPGVSRDIYVPKSSKAYVVINQSNAAVVVRGGPSTPTTGVTIAASARAVVAWDGSDFVTIASSEIDGVSTISFGSTGLTPNTGTSGAVTVAGTLAVGSGGTGQITYTDGQLLIGNTTGNTLTKATLTQGTGVTITNGSGSISIANSAPMTYPGAGVAVSTGSAWTTSLTAPSGTIVGTSDTQTLTNKTITQRVSSTTSISSPLAWNSDNFDMYAATAQAGNFTISADAGTPTDGRRAIFRIASDATPRVVTFTGGASKAFKPVGVTLTTSGSDFTYTLTASKITYFGCIYNTNSARWEIVALSQEA